MSAFETCFSRFDFAQAILVIVLVSSAYTNWDKFEYSTAPTVAEQAKDILSNSFNVTLTCTRLQRTKWFGFDQRSAAFSMADLDIDGLIDLLNYGSAGDLADDDDAQTFDDSTDDTQATDDGNIQATGDLLGDYTTNSTDDYYVDDTTGEQVRGLQTADDDNADDDSVDEGDTIRALLKQFTFVIAEACLDFEASDVSSHHLRMCPFRDLTNLCCLIFDNRTREIYFMNSQQCIHAW